MTKYETEQIDAALMDMERFFAWLRSNQVAVCRRGKDMTIMAYTNQKSGETLTEIDKRVGSTIQILEGAQKRLFDLKVSRGHGAKQQGDNGNA